MTDFRLPEKVDAAFNMINSFRHLQQEEQAEAHLRCVARSLFDGSLQAVERSDKAAFSFQGHPEASPGPHDVAPLFDRFFELIAAHRSQQGAA